MPASERIKLASLEKRKRICVICGAGFIVKSVERVGKTCSPSCLRARMSEAARNRKASPETRAKMSAAIKAKYADPAYAERRRNSGAVAIRKWHADPDNAAAFAKRMSDRMKLRHTEPEFQERRNARSSRVMKRNWENYRELFTQQSADRFHAGIGIATPESEAKKRIASKWILKKANNAMHAETDYNEVYAVVQARIRREFPYDGPGETADYYDYCKKLGYMVTTSQECRAIADPFMSKAIPRFAKEWQARKEREGG